MTRDQRPVSVVPFWICALIAVTAVIVVALSAYAWRGSYTRYITDDFCTAAFLRERGFWGAMQRHREEWSGRFSFYAIKAALEAVGPATAPIVPGASVALFAGCAVWALRRTLAAPWPLALFGGCGFAFAAFDASPEVLAIGGPLVWETGVVTYTLPLILITAWLGLFSTGRAGWTRGAIGAAVLLTAGGLSETSLAAQCAFTALLWLGALCLREIDATRIAA